MKNLCYEENTAYYGNNLIYGHENPKKSRMDCQQSCQFNLNCNFWTFRKPDHRGSLGLCYLKTKRENVSNNVSSYVSGSKNCQLPEWTGRISKFDIILKKTCFFRPPENSTETRCTEDWYSTKMGVCRSIYIYGT